MGRVFSWMRPNDLVWNYWVNNYLMGNPPPAFDILYWNNDTTRLPGEFHGQLLDIFGEQSAARARRARASWARRSICAEVDCDKFVLGGVTDHITPWKGVYRTARVFGGKTEFVLSSSGHIQSLINPPGNPKGKVFRWRAISHRTREPGSPARKAGVRAPGGTTGGSGSPRVPARCVRPLARWVAEATLQASPRQGLM